MPASSGGLQENTAVVDGDIVRPPSRKPSDDTLRGAPWWHNRFAILAGRVAVVALFLASWQFAVSQGVLDPLFVSTPADVWAYLRDAVQTDEFWLDTRVTLLETLWGFVLGASAGILTGLVLARFLWLDVLVDPLLTFLNSLPRVALAPLFILWFGIGEMSKVMLAASLVYFILAANTRSGVKSVDQDMIVAARLLGATRLQLLRKVVFPGAVPAVFTGLRLGAVYALLGVVAGEIIAAENGLGQQLTYLSGTFQTDGVIAILIVLGLIGSALNGVMSGVERRLLRWQDESV